VICSEHLCSAFTRYDKLIHCKWTAKAENGAIVCSAAVKIFAGTFERLLAKRREIGKMPEAAQYTAGGFIWRHT